MPTIKFTINDDYYQRLEEAAREKGMSIQDFVRHKLFDLNTIFTVEEAVKRIQEGNFENRIFTLPDVYGNEWTLQRGPAGVFGKNFYNYITDNPDLHIRDKGYDKKERREIYTYKEGFNE